MNFFDDFSSLSNSFYATLLLATVLAFLGVHVILRRVVFVGIALSEMSSLGIASSFYLERFEFTEPGRMFSFAREHLIMGTLLNFLGLVFLSPTESKRLSREARIGICFAAAGALAILLVALSPRGMDEIRALMAHDPLFISHQDLTVLFSTMIPALLGLVLFFRRFLLVAFDREMAISLGVHAKNWDMFFYLLLGLSIAMAIHFSGVLFAIGFLVLPSSAALSVGRRPWTIFLIASAIGLFSAVVGYVAGYHFDLPLGPTAVGIAFVIFILTQAGRRMSEFARIH
ncbi:MAG: metal ABC transporter permease [Planctomycetes bacterium]|nr:metal ABC transporter permease [Planctomycetota bacterium]